MNRRHLPLLVGTIVCALWLVAPAAAWADTCAERARAIAQGTETMAGETDCNVAGVYAAAATVSVAATAASVAAATLGIGLASTGASGLGLGTLLPLPRGMPGAPSAPPATTTVAADAGPGQVQRTPHTPPSAPEGIRAPSGTKAAPPPASPGGGRTAPLGTRAGASGTGKSRAPADTGSSRSRATSSEASSGEVLHADVLAHLPSEEIRDAVLHLFSPGKVVGWKFHDIEHFREEYWKAKALENPWEAHQTKDHVVFMFSREFGIKESAARSLLELPKAQWEPVATIIASLAH